jgi:hypothetical protein
MSNKKLKPIYEILSNLRQPPVGSRGKCSGPLSRK